MVHILASPGHVRWGRAQPGPLLRANDLLPFEKGWQSLALFYDEVEVIWFDKLRGRNRNIRGN
jgi:hypothetical protein